MTYAKNVNLGSRARIVDITKTDEYEKHLYRCIAGPPSKHSKKRMEYLRQAVPKGFHKKLLLLGEQIVGQIEYSPAEVSYYPIIGENVVVLNCIWVLRKAGGRDFGKRLLEDMIEDEKEASGFATISLENHWSPWFRKDQMEKLGFKSLDLIEVVHKAKHTGHRFKIYLMWLPTTGNARKLKWDKTKLLEGTDFCAAHPLYHPESTKLKEIFERC
jgi:hypothetical protein